ncbi:MAG: GntR family transcriptional regulator [Synergistaceae bacterium]|jgi:GntR family transcriptional repressor for pyruvate dehydrogenase complex|nr:GntR family transcriptional regulator [Synergistaceae bacterium]PKL05024.1 MAG: hypothetical protein CVV54_03465 [Synergistetes bacterium HGW-Synergistetes-1]
MNLKRENTLSQLVLENIQNSIRDGEFKPGECLPSERELAERYGVGKSSIREAIKMLQVLGVAESSQGKGTYLRETLGTQILRPLLLDMMLQRSNAEELYEFRVIFDIAALKLAITKATEDEKHIIRQKFHEYKTLSEAHIPAADQADQEFHKIILNATRNQFVIKMGTLVMELCRPYSKKGNDVLDKTVMDNHEKMMEIFCSGDTTNIEDVIRNSLIVFRHILDNGLHKDI